MLAGLLFANHPAEDRPDRLIATLPFAGATLIEHQARQLVAAGASQLIVVATRLTPELLGALSCVGREAAVDAVRSASEAAEKLHPLARVVMMADGLVATDEAVRALAREGGDALLVLPGDEAERDWERLGGQLAWAGIARLQPRRVGEVAALPRDYDTQSALVRVAEQAGAGHVTLSADARRRGHGLASGERDLAERGRRVLASLFAGRRNWFDRWLVGPVAQIALPPLVARGVSGGIVGLAAGVLALFGFAALLEGYGATGALLELVGTLLATMGTTLAGLRGERRAERWQRVAVTALPLAAVALLGWIRQAETLDDGALVTAAGVLLLAGLAERAGMERERWWGSPAAYLLLAVVGAAVGRIGWGLGLAALYAAATLGTAIERLRQQG